MSSLKLKSSSSGINQKISQRVDMLEYLMTKVMDSKLPSDVALEVNINCSCFTAILTSLRDSVPESGMTLEQMLIMRETMSSSEKILSNYQEMLQ